MTDNNKNDDDENDNKYCDPNLPSVFLLIRTKPSCFAKVPDSILLLVLVSY
jgi:hypothetical protein